ncbi:MAG TPA: TIGR04086 family membrane protein [Oscillospiraceae bacterium]|nr:TIGR04086 family membrane protein [Oscillospiraceae bacterium]
MRQQDVSKSSYIKENLKTFLISSAFGFVFILLFTALFAYLLTLMKTTDNRIYYFEFLILAAGALISGFISAKKGRGKGLVLGAFSGLPLTLIVLIIPFFMFESIVTSRLLFLAPLILLSAVVGGIIGANKR